MMENFQKKNKTKKMLQPRQLKTSKKVVKKEVKLPAVVAEEKKQERKPQMLISEINSSIFQFKICEKMIFIYGSKRQ